MILRKLFGLVRPFLSSETEEKLNKDAKSTVE